MSEPTAVTPEAASDEAIEAEPRDTTMVYRIDGTGDDAWLVAETGHCTCGTDGEYGHERYCGQEGLAQIRELRDAVRAVAALPVERAAWERQVRETIAEAGIAVADYLRGLDYATTMSSLSMRHGEEIAAVVFDASLVRRSREGGKR